MEEGGHRTQVEGCQGSGLGDGEREKGCISGGLGREVEKATRCKCSSQISTPPPSAAGSKLSSLPVPIPMLVSRAMQGEEA